MDFDVARTESLLVMLVVVSCSSEKVTLDGDFARPSSSSSIGFGSARFLSMTVSTLNQIEFLLVSGNGKYPRPS